MRSQSCTQKKINSLKHFNFKIGKLNVNSKTSKFLCKIEIEGKFFDLITTIRNQNKHHS